MAFTYILLVLRCSSSVNYSKGHLGTFGVWESVVS